MRPSLKFGIILACIIALIATGIVAAGFGSRAWLTAETDEIASPALQQAQTERERRDLVKRFERNFNINCLTYTDIEKCLDFGERMLNNPELEEAVRFVQKNGLSVYLKNMVGAQFVVGESVIIIDYDDPSDEEIIAFLAGPQQ